MPNSAGIRRAQSAVIRSAPPAARPAVTSASGPRSAIRIVTARRSTSSLWTFAAALFFILILNDASAAADSRGFDPFTPGNIVIVRVGDGRASLTNAAAPVFLDEYTPGPPGPPTALVQSIPLPTATAAPPSSNRRLTLTGTAISEGALSLSTAGWGGSYLLLAGYDADPGTPSLSTTSTGGASPVLRVIARVALLGGGETAIDTSTATSSFSGSSIRAAASTDGAQLWAVGGNTGIIHTTLGSSPPAPVTIVSSASVNNRVLRIFNNQLYLSSASGINTYKGVNAVGFGTPTTPGQTITRLPGLSDGLNPSNYGFFFADLSADVPGLDTLYIADDEVGGFSKFCLVEGAWTLKGIFGTAADDNYRGVTGSVAGPPTTVHLYLIRKGGSGPAGGGELVTLTDSAGYDAGFSSTTPTLLATAAPNTAFRGLQLIPGPTPLPCPEDLTLDLVVSVADLLLLIAAWGPNAGHVADLNFDGTVSVGDLLILISAWGPC